jgi:tyrosyl-tRNA synthetase
MSNDETAELFERGVANFIDPEGSFKEKILKKIKGEYDKDIVIKLGADPNRPDIHLGHAVILRKLRQFQDIGCKVVFVVGDFTARIGDPSGKSKVRPEIEQAEVERNAATYIAQIGKILRTDDPKLFSWIRNSDWFLNITDLNLPDDTKVNMDIKGQSIKIEPNSLIGKAIVYGESRMQKKISPSINVITMTSFLWTLKHLTHQRLIDRDMFQERLKKGEELYMHELMYPVLQGIDSFVIAQIYGSCDLEIGGTDQTFNNLMGREVMKTNHKDPQSVMTLEILPGTDGGEKMGKSLDNYIGIAEEAGEIFGKVMSIPDSVMTKYYELATYTPLAEVEEIKAKLESGKLHPRDAKLRLAREITAIYHGDKQAKEAEENFIETFSKGGTPKDIETVKVSSGSKLVEVLLSQGLVDSKSEFQRLQKEGAVKDAERGEAIMDQTVEKNMTVRVGKHRFIKIEVM